MRYLFSSTSMRCPYANGQEAMKIRPSITPERCAVKRIVATGGHVEVGLGTDSLVRGYLGKAIYQVARAP
jgi:hypothetical protein